MEPDRGKGPDPRPDAAHQRLESRRQRARQACAPCRSRKRKCDGHYPCKTCVEFEYECFYRETPRRQARAPPAASAAAAAAAGPPTGGSGSTSAPASASRENEAGHDDGDDDNEASSGPGSVVSDHNPFKQQAILDPLKIRYSSASSAVAFPRILGLKLNRDRAPRLHSFGWHLGIRAEPQLPYTDIRSIIGLVEARELVLVYWRAVHPAFGFLDRDTFERNLQERFGGAGDRRYDCVISGVLALGSFFSGGRDDGKEQGLVKLTHDILDVWSTQHSPELEHAAGWILRVLYLRLASRPYTSWVASCTLMHLVEHVGLHKDLQTVAIISPAMPHTDAAEMEYRRRLAWTARVLNRLHSYEAGRNEVQLDYTCREPADDGVFPHALLQCTSFLPSDASCPSDGAKLPQLKEAMMNVAAVPVRNETHELLRADLIICMFRRLWLVRSTLSQSDTKVFYAAGEKLLLAARALAASSRPWWAVLSTPFQYVCALVAIDTPQSLSKLPAAMECLEYISAVFSTHLAQEALETARHLVMLSHERKSSDLKALQPFLPPNRTEPAVANSYTDPAAGVLPEFADNAFFLWPEDSLDWGYLEQTPI